MKIDKRPKRLRRKRFYKRLAITLTSLLLIGGGGLTGYRAYQKHLAQLAAAQRGWTKIDGVTVVKALPAPWRMFLTGTSSTVASTGHFNKAVTLQTIGITTKQTLTLLGAPTDDYDNQATEKLIQKTHHVAKGTQSQTLNQTLYPKLPPTALTTHLVPLTFDPTPKAFHLMNVAPLGLHRKAIQIMLTRIKIHDVIIVKPNTAYTIEGQRQVYQKGKWVTLAKHINVNLIVKKTGAVTYSDDLLSGQFKPAKQSLATVVKKEKFNAQLFQ